LPNNGKRNLLNVYYPSILQSEYQTEQTTGIVKSMQLSIDKIIKTKQNKNLLLTQAMAFINLTNTFNSDSRNELFQPSRVLAQLQWGTYPRDRQ
jgi:hypothetical protein